MLMPREEIVRFYDATFVDQTLQDALLSAPDLSAFKSLVLTEAQKRGFNFSRTELDSSFDGMGERDTFSGVDFGSPWISRIMRYGWVPKGYSRT
jgi:hypothetical protein